MSDRSVQQPPFGGDPETSVSYLTTVKQTHARSSCNSVCEVRQECRLYKLISAEPINSFCNQPLKILSFITEELRACDRKPGSHRHVELFDVYLDHTYSILPVQTPEDEEVFEQSFHEDGVPATPTNLSTSLILPSVHI